MKFLFAMIFVLSSSLSAWGGWIPSNELRKEIIDAMYDNDDREAVYQLLQSNLKRGMDVESPGSRTKMSLLANFATIEWYLVDRRDEGRTFTDWDQKIFDLLLQYGADVNYSWLRPSQTRTNILLATIDQRNLEMVKMLIKAGANPKVSFSADNFNLRRNVLVGPIVRYDGEMFSYLLPLTNFPINEIDYCSAADGAFMVPDRWSREVAYTIIRPAFKDYDLHKCKKLLGLE